MPGMTGLRRILQATSILNPSRKIIGAISIPSSLTLSATSIPANALIGSDIGMFSALGGGTMVFTIIDSAGGYVSASGRRCRLEQLPAGSKTITVRASNEAGSIDATFTLGTIPVAMPTGLLARFDTLDATKLVPNGSDATKLQTWTDRVSGFVLDGGTTQATIDTANKLNGAPGIYAAAGSAMVQMKATAAAVNDPLKAMLNAANAAYTIIAVVDTIAASPTTARELISWGTNNSGATGGARNYLLWRHATGSTNYSLLRGDTANALSNQGGNFGTPIGAGKSIIAIRSDGSTFGESVNKSEGSAVTAINDGAVTADTFSIFNRAVSALAGNNFDGRLYGLLIWPRQLSSSELSAAIDSLAADFAYSLPGSPVYLDLSTYDLVYQDDFDGASPINPDPATDLTSPTGWLPYYLGVTTRNQYGSNGALGSEVGWYADYRNARMSKYKDRLFQQADGIVKLRAIPRPSELSDLSLKNGEGVECTYLNAAMLSYNFFSQQYGYFESRVLQPPDQAGVFPADWFLPGSGNWLPAEFDSHEGFGANTDSQRAANLHSAPYFPRFANQDMKQPIIASVPSRKSAYALYGFEVTPGGIIVWHNRIKLGTFVPYNGAVGITITAGGSNVVADNGTADGTIVITAPSSDATMQSARANLTVAGGIVTAGTIAFPGVKMGATPAWVRSTAQAGSTAIGGGVTLSTTIANDPALAMIYHTPMYWLLAMQMGSFTGTPDGVTEYELAIDYVRAYKKKLAAPTIASGTATEAQAIFDRATAVSSPFSATQQARINTFVQFAKATQLRFDTSSVGPGDGSGADWDITKLSLWDAFEQLYLRVDAPNFTQAQSLISWKNPGSGDLTLLGSPTYQVGAGWTIPYQSGLQGPTIVGSNLIRATDSHFGIDIASITVGNFTRTIIGAGDNFSLRATTAGTVLQMMAPYAGSTYKAPEVAKPGHYIAARGYRPFHLEWRDGKLFRHSGGAAIATTGLGNMIIGGSNGPDALAVRQAHWGRRLMPAEVDAFMQAVAAL